MAAEHGTRYGYISGCRCDDCTRANSDYQVKSNRERKSKPTPPHVHGTRNGYANYGCRCDACTAAHIAACRDYKRRRRAAAR